MKHVVIPAFVVASFASAVQSTQARSFAFDFEYYPKVANFSIYDFTTIDPHAEADLSIARNAGKKVIAYISVGEVGGTAWYRQEALATGVTIKYTNPDWGSSVMDVSDPRWADFVINRLARIAADKGFDGFFLDTVDVIYDLGESEPANQAAYYSGMANLIKGLRAAYPTKEIISNRGFEIIDDIRSSIDGFLVESLFQKYRSGAFIAQDPYTTSLLLEWLIPIRDRGTPVYVIDYVDPANPALAAECAARIQSYGFNALVVGQHLDGTVLAPALTAPTPLPAPAPVETAPAIVSQPFSVSVAPGATVTFSVGATGSNLSYQWRFNGANVAGATGPQLVLRSVTRGQAGNYSVVVQNTGGSVNSSTAVLKVNRKFGR